jgi:hypothetical protein
MGGGGLLQLVAYGAQDIYLTGNPQITFFKVVYRRHTNFSIESIQQTLNGTPDFGSRVNVTISRNGDLITRCHLVVDLPSVIGVTGDTGATPDENGRTVKWVRHLGNQLIKFVEIEIGGQRIDKHYGDWLHIWNELTLDESKSDGYDEMIGNVAELYTAAHELPEARLNLMMH